MLKQKERFLSAWDARPSDLRISSLIYELPTVAPCSSSGFMEEFVAEIHTEYVENVAVLLTLFR